jgi:hypothetical protein
MDVNGTSQRVRQLIDEEFAQRITEINEEAVTKRCEEIVAKINKNLDGANLDEEAQQQLGKCMGLLADVALTDVLWLRNVQVVNCVEVAVSALLSNPPKPALAKSIKDQLQKELHPTRRQTLERSFRWSMMTNPASAIVIGLGLLFCVLLLAFAGLGFGFSQELVAWILFSNCVIVPRTSGPTGSYGEPLRSSPSYNPRRKQIYLKLPARNGCRNVLETVAE